MRSRGESAAATAEAGGRVAVGSASTRRVTVGAGLLGLSIVVYVIEASYFPALPIPGAKLGLANAITLVLLLTLGWRAALANTVLRTVMGSLIIGTFMTPAFLMSFGAGLCSSAAMIFCYLFAGKRFSVVGVSIVGATVHNLTQLALATALLGTYLVWFQLPWMLLIGLVSGIVNALIAAPAITAVPSVWSRPSLEE